MALSDWLSLEAAIEEKYCCREREREKWDGKGEGKPLYVARSGRRVSESAVSLKPGASPVRGLRVVILEEKRVSHVYCSVTLASLCPCLRELHLSNNRVCCWSDLSSLLTALPNLTFLDLTHNPLNLASSSLPSTSTTSTTSTSTSSSSLTTLVLNSTHIPWTVLQKCLEMLPNISELYLAHNCYTDVTFDPSFSHTALQKLHLNDNILSEWVELRKLSSAFPHLVSLIIISNPLEVITGVTEGEFPSLRSLSLNSTWLSDWTSVEQLSNLSTLREINMLRVPLGEEMEEKERRYEVIARLPALERLNKSKISESEREDAERWAIRYYQAEGESKERAERRSQLEEGGSPSEQQDLGEGRKEGGGLLKSPEPAFLHRLVAKHGQLQALVNVNLSPPTLACVEFHFEHGHMKQVEEHCVSLTQTAAELKQWVCSHLNSSTKIPISANASKLRMFYVNPELSEYAGDLLLGSRRLYSYLMKDGDRIRVLL